MQYEQLGEICTHEVGIKDIDNPELVAERENLTGCKRARLELPVSKTFRRWVKEHGEEIDECKLICYRRL